MPAFTRISTERQRVTAKYIPAMMRTHLCGELGEANIGQQVTVTGWVNRRREHSQHLAFVDLRDHSGIVQCVVDNSVDVRSGVRGARSRAR